MVKQIYIDEIAQSFVSDGNVFLKLSAVIGDVDALGNDIKHSPVTLVIPITRFQAFSENIAKAKEIHLQFQQVNVELPPQETPKTTLGSPLTWS